MGGLREEIITSPEQVLELLETGEANRHVGSTKMNEKSSRSHTIFRMVSSVLEQKRYPPEICDLVNQGNPILFNGQVSVAASDSRLGSLVLMLCYT